LRRSASSRDGASERMRVSTMCRTNPPNTPSKISARERRR
jgi:hypothetical protein